MQDVVPPSTDRSIRNIPLPAHRNKRLPEEMPQAHEPTPAKKVRRTQETPTSNSEKRTSSKFLWFLAVALVGVLLALVATLIFGGASVVVYPRADTIVTPTSLIAFRDAPLGALPFETAKVEAITTRSVAADGVRDVARQSSGTIIVYNEYSTASQRLIKNTRFEAPDGKIYRINDSVTVPGTTKDAAGKVVAGQIEAQVFADSAGPSYDRGMDTFTIPGFKGDPRYAKFYAKSKTPISGGFVGKENIVADAERKAAEEGMKAELTEVLQKRLSEVAPAGRILVPNSIAYTFATQPDQTAAGNTATLTLKGTALGALIEEGTLAAAIAEMAIAEYDGQAIYFADTGILGISAKTPVSEAAVKLEIAGGTQTTLVWKFDPAEVQKALVGVEENLFGETLRQLTPAIVDGKARMRPFWKNSFPEDAEDITVTVGDPKAAE